MIKAEDLREAEAEIARLEAEVARLLTIIEPSGRTGGVLAEVSAERAHQRRKGFDDEHDDHHRHGEITIAAAELLVDGTDAKVVNPLDEWGLAERHRGDRRYQLVIAAALAVAEIERLDREARRG